MLVITHNIKISASAKKIFDFTSNYENDPLWRGNVKEMKITKLVPGMIGTMTEENLTLLGNTYITAAEVTEYEKNSRIAFRSIGGKPAVNGYREIQNQNGCANFIYYLEIEQSGMMKFTGSILKYFFGKQLKKDLLTLKTILEK